MDVLQIIVHRLMVCRRLTNGVGLLRRIIGRRALLQMGSRSLTMNIGRISRVSFSPLRRRRVLIRRKSMARNGMERQRRTIIMLITCRILTTLLRRQDVTILSPFLLRSVPFSTGMDVTPFFRQIRKRVCSRQIPLLCWNNGEILHVFRLMNGQSRMRASIIHSHLISFPLIGQVNS